MKQQNKLNKLSLEKDQIKTDSKQQPVFQMSYPRPHKKPEYMLCQVCQLDDKQTTSDFRSIRPVLIVANTSCQMLAIVANTS